MSGPQTLEEEEPYEWVCDAQGNWAKVTAKNGNGRKCGRCGCACPCTCADCLYQCCA